MDQDGGAYKHDPSMDESGMNTVTASSHQMYQQGADRPQTSYSDTGFHRSYASPDNTPEPPYRYVIWMELTRGGFD